MNSIAWLQKLVSIDTTSYLSNLALIDVISAWFADHKISSDWIYNTDQQKANLFAILPAYDGSIHDGLLLSGHTDVVTVDGQIWNTNPFLATQIKNKIYGRGTSDMKAFLAVVLALLPEFIKLKLSKPLYFSFTFDEEIGCAGAKFLIEHLRKKNIKPVGCIIGEPTEMRPITGHKGIHGFRCHIQGNAAHSSLQPNGCNAIEHGAELIHWIRNFAKKLCDKGLRDEFYDVPFSTLSVNLIQGGNAINIIPDTCEFLLELRNLPVEKPAEIIEKIKVFAQKQLLPEMQKEYSAANIEINPVFSVPALHTDENAIFTQLIRKVTAEKNIFKVAYATEGGIFQQAGIPTVICGPGSIEQAHRANEFVTLEQIMQCEEFIRSLVKEY